MEALEVVRERTPGVPFIFVSGTLGEDIAIEALHRGATDYVLKQRLDRLAPSVRRAVEESAMRLRQRAQEEALRNSQLRFRELADAIPQLVWATDTKGRVVYANRWAREYGEGVPEIDTFPGVNICHSQDQLRLRGAWLQCLRGIQPGDLEFRVRQGREGAFRWHLCRFVPLHNSSNQVEGWVAAAVDVEEQKVRERELVLSQRDLQMAKEMLELRVQERTQAYAALSARLMTIQDEERRRLARDLHDGVGQFLAAIKMNLDTLRQTYSPKSETESKSLTESCALLDMCLTEVRTLSYLLHPPLLDDCGFGPAARWLVEGFADRSGISVELSIDKDLGRLPSEIEVVLFRILQESLSNIHRHARATTANISVRTHEEWIEMTIRDNGSGLSDEQLRLFQTVSFDGASVGVGIAGMRERVRDLGGKLSFIGDGGTTIVVRLPRSRRSEARPYLAAIREPRQEIV